MRQCNVQETTCGRTDNMPRATCDARSAQNGAQVSVWESQPQSNVVGLNFVGRDFLGKVQAPRTHVRTHLSIFSQAKLRKQTQ